MANAKNPRRRLMAVYHILYTQSDKENPLSLQDIKNKLTKFEIETDDRTLVEDINALNEGFTGFVNEEFAKLDDRRIHIETTGARPKYYYIEDRELSFSELKTVISIISTAKFLSRSDTNKIIKKLKYLCSEKQQKCVNTRDYIEFDKIHYSYREPVKITEGVPNLRFADGSIFDKIDFINNAINEKHRISFKYNGHILSTKKDASNYTKIRNKWHKSEEISPYKIIFADNAFRLIGVKNNDTAKEHYLVSYDIQKITDIEEKRKSSHGSYLIEEFEKKYNNGLIAHFDDSLSDPMDVVLQFHNCVLEKIIDRFGTEIKVKKIDEVYFSIKVHVYVNDEFIGWVLSMGDKAKVVSPIDLVARIKKQLNITRYMYMKD